MLRKIFCYLIALVACILLVVQQEQSETGDGDELIWAFNGLSVFLQLTFFVRALSIPSQTFGVFALTIERMLLSDVSS